MLCEAAWLEARWRQKYVGTRLQPVSQSFLIADMNRDPLRRLTLQRLKGGFQHRITLSDKRELRAGRHYSWNIL